MGTVLAIGSTKEVADGVLRGDATFESLGLTPDKVRFKFMKKERVPGRGPARYKESETIRNVTADALQRVAREAGGSGEEEQESPGGAFATMAEAATTPCLHSRPRRAGAGSTRAQTKTSSAQGR